jgi:hypothetical protein
MHDDIDIFLERMDNTLTLDLVAYIGSIIYKDLNLDIIKKQKQFKYILHKELFYKFNVLYNDDNILLYMNKDNICMLHSNPNTNQSLYLYSNGIQQPQNTLTSLSHNANDDDNTNDIILFENSIVQRRIKLYIVYL